MRLYRGLKQTYRPEQVGAGQETLYWTNFTDCPLAALQYASGRWGEVIVLDVPEEASGKVSEALWLGARTRRLLVWGRFDGFIVASFPAKELRAQIRRGGIQSMSEDYKAVILENYIEERLAAESNNSSNRENPMEIRRSHVEYE